MANPGLGGDAATLADAAVGRPVEVVRVEEHALDLLLSHGVRPGVRLVVHADAPFGGPRIVRLGPGRVAIARTLAATIHVRAAGR